MFTLGGGAMIWRSVKLSAILESTLEAEYIAASMAAKEIVWLKKFYSDLGLFQKWINHSFCLVTVMRQ